MFLDFGLTTSEFATLNLVWAIGIILLEVPSGALADHLGRKLVIISAVLMIFEIAILLITPVGSGIVFWMFFINRILSGELTAASGAEKRFKRIVYLKRPEKVYGKNHETRHD